MTEDRLKLYQFEESPFCEKIRRVMQAKGLSFEVEEIALSQSLVRLKKINAMGKLPCLEHGDRLMGDSTEIAHYLEATFPDPALIPSTPRERALCHMLEDWADESLYFYHVRMRFTFPHNARRHLPLLVRHDTAMAGRLASLVLPNTFKAQLHQQGVGRKPDALVVLDVRRHVEALAGWLDGDWLIGDRLTLADLAVFVQISGIRRTEEGERMIDERPRLAAWLDRVDAASSAP